MKLENLKIGTLLKTGFTLLLLFVIVIGFISYQQSSRMHQQTEDMYNHPLQVRRSIGELTATVHAIRVDMKNLFLASEKEEIEADLHNLELLDANAFKQIEVFRKLYLGPVSDVDALEYEYIKWKSIRAEIIRLHQSGEIQEGASRTKSSGIGGKQAEVVLRSLDKLSAFATGKGDELYANSMELNNALNKQLLSLIGVIVLISLFVSWFLLRAMRKPIDELIEATQRFHKGDLMARSSNTSNNELGELSNSFNALADDIQANLSLSENIENIAGIMLSEDDTKLFFKKTLHAISQHTNSQIAAVYLLSDDQKTYEHFESIGLDTNARQSFTAEHFEGEFGAVLSSRKVHYLKNIPEDTRFAFHTVSGKFIPREILTIPVTTNEGVSAIISLASLGFYSKHSVQLIDKILNTLSARIEGLLAFGKIKQFSAKLEVQNTELEASQRELSSQSAELMEQNTELEQQKKQLSQASQMKTAFFSNMSHELRTPLNSVIALSGVLYKRLANKIPEDEYSYLEVINRNGKNLLNLINDVLDIARIEAGHEDIELSEFNCSQLMDELVNSMSLEANQKKIKLIHTKTDATLPITSDEKKCRHILQNLISNAVKFTEEGKVEVISKQIDKNIVITVTDTGIGISEDQISHIFDEFKQADSSTSRKYGGTGLGLAIAKKYTHLLGGNISVKSEPGKGTEFTLVLPLQYNRENSQIEEENLGSLTHSRRFQLSRIPDNPEKSILLVDDNESALVQVKDILEDKGYHVLLASNGSEALAIIDHTIPDAMILDLMMPEMDGFQVLRSIREQEQTSQLPVLILTAKHITKEELKFLKHNHVQQLIQKGDVNANEMLEAVANMLFAEILESDAPKAETKTTKEKPLVLIVEDNPDNMLSVKAVLNDAFTILEAVNGIEGVEKAKKFKPDLILMDIALPQMDGIEAFKIIRNKPELQYIKVIALTASAMTQDREVLLSHGFDAFIAKPIDEQQFFDTINSTLYGK
ncbi:response regulator [uncultured Draconibacterium sp.]|uniref:response regulator n=1 Tax=uncultured Draconibacterium sp. TaxID=1573823 RepID=UPI0025D285C2|nr:response regulator [uncultured Draconibacterium sp.]